MPFKKYRMLRSSFGVRKFNSLILSASLMTALDFLMLFLNTVVVGNMVGMEGLAAIDLINPIEFWVEFVSASLSIGTSYLYNQAIGAADEKRAGQIWAQGVMLTVTAGAVLAGLAMLLEKPYFAFFDAGQTVMAQTHVYYRYMRINFLMEPFYYLMYEMVYMDGDEKLSMITNLVHIPVQLALSVVLCRAMGIGGIALAGILSKLISLAMFSVHFFRKCNTMRFIASISLRGTWEVITISMTDAVLNLCWMATQLVLNKLTLLGFGAGMLPVFTILCSAFELCLFFDGIGEAFAPIANVYIGEKNYLPLNRLFDYSLRFSVIEGCAAAVLLFLAAPLFPALYGMTDAAQKAEVIRALRVLAFSFPGISVVFDISSAYVMTERIGLSTLMVVLAHFAGNVLTASLLYRPLGFTGIALSYAAAPLITILIFIPIIRRIGRKGDCVMPWLTPKPSPEMFYIDGAASAPEIVAMRDAIGDFLKRSGRDRQVMQVMLLVEELSLLIAERNKKRVWLEYTVTLENDSVLISERDTGVIFNPLEEDAKHFSFRTYITDRLLTALPGKRHMITIGINRNMFRL